MKRIDNEDGSYSIEFDPQDTDLMQVVEAALASVGHWDDRDG